MDRSHITLVNRWTKAAGWLWIMGFLVVQPALAHVPYLEEEDFSAEAPFQIQQPLEKSRAFYSWFETGEDIDVFTFQITEPTRLFAQAIVPVCQGYELVLPWFAVVGPGLPVPDVELPFELPPGYGATVIQNEEPWTPRETLYEPFGDKWYFEGPAFDETVAATGTWYLYFWNPQGVVGDYTAIVGPLEIWNIRDILRAIIYTPLIRAGQELHIECLVCGFVDERVLKDGDGDGIPDICDEIGCFIATAAFGTEMAGKIDTLRSFRDDYLLTNGPGRSLVEFYYENSPPLADVVRAQGWLSAIVRVLLLPIVGLASLLV